MERLQIYLMGAMSLSLGDQRLTDFPTRKAKSLFAYLVLHRNQVLSREILASEFWGELPEKRARKALNTDFWRISRLFRDSHIDPDLYLHSCGEGIGFITHAPYWLDLAQFDETLTQTLKTNPPHAEPALIHKLSAAVALYRGELLHGIFDDWCLIQRESLKTRYLSALEFLIHAHIARQAWQQALILTQQLLSIDPLQEQMHRVAMQCYYVLGNRPAAIKQYAACVQTLRRELNIAPMEETTRSYSLIADSKTPMHSAATLASLTASLPQSSSLDAISVAISKIDTARNWLVDASRTMSDLSRHNIHQ